MILRTSISLSKQLAIGFLKQGDERFVLIPEKQNKGFAYANNIAIRYVLSKKDADYIWILNNDTVIKADSLTKLLSCFSNAQTKIGFLGSKTMDYKNRKVVQNAGGRFNKYTGYSVLIGMGEHDDKKAIRKKFVVDYIVGASMFFHVSLIDKVGLMPEDYFLYYEDIDWSISAKKAGLTNITCMESVIYHKQGVSTKTKLLNKELNLQIKTHLYMSYLILYRRHYKHLLPVAYFILFKQWAGRIYHKKWQEANVIFKVIFTR